MNINLEAVVMWSLGLFVLFFILKNVFLYKKGPGGEKVPFGFYMFLLIYIFVLPVVTVTLVVFTLYRQLVSWILKNKYGVKFGGLLEGADSVHTTEGSTNVIDILIIVEYDEKLYSETLYDITKQKMYNCFLSTEKLPKLSSIVQQYMGYYYMLKNEVTIDDCVKKMRVVKNKKEKLDKEDVLNLIIEYRDLPLPKNGIVLWEMLVGSQPVKWNNQSNETKNYPILFRFSHALGDGKSLYKLLVELYADNPNVKIGSPEILKKDVIYEGSNRLSNNKNNNEMMIFYKQILDRLEFLLMNLYVLFLAPTTLFLQSKVINLQGPSLSKEKIEALNVDISGQNLQKIKKIKNRFSGTSFTDVLLTAFSASLNEYFTKNSSSYPESIMANIAVLLSPLGPGNFTPEKSDADINLINKFGVLIFKLPLHVVNGYLENKPLVGRLKILQKEIRGLKETMQHVVTYWLQSVVMGVLPTPVTKNILKIIPGNVALSIFPGPSKVTLYGRSLVHDVAYWTIVEKLGITFSVLTYDGRLQMTLHADKALVSDKIAAKNILDGIYKYLDLLDKETS